MYFHMCLLVSWFRMAAVMLQYGFRDQSLTINLFVTAVICKEKQFMTSMFCLCCTQAWKETIQLVLLDIKYHGQIFGRYSKAILFQGYGERKSIAYYCMGAALGIDTLWRTHDPKSLFVKTSKQNEQKSVIFIIVSLVCIFATNVFSNAFKYSTFWLYSLQKLMLPSGNYNQILIEFSYKVRYIYSLILCNEILLSGEKNACVFFIHVDCMKIW